MAEALELRDEPSGLALGISFAEVPFVSKEELANGILRELLIGD